MAGPQYPVGFTGALLDTRSPDEKAGDYQFKEIVASAVTVNWTTKQWADFRRFPVQNQGSSLTCVWQSMRKLMRVLFMVNRGLDLDFSAVYGYRKRSNYPGGGTIASDAFLVATEGVTLNALLPSDNITEVQANATVIQSYQDLVAKGFQLPHHIQFANGDLESIAGTIQQTKKGVMVWFYFTADEWGVDVPKIIDKTLTSQYQAQALVHSVVAVDYGIFNGEKGLFVEDSAHFGGKWERFVPETFFKARNIFSAYPINFSFEPDADPNAKPHYVNGDVVSLQNCLKFEGVFPTNIDSTGFYGAITKQAVKEFQNKYGLEQVGTVGPMTSAKLAILYP